MQKVLVTAEHFYPAFKGGGPIESLVNVIHLLQQEIDFWVLASAFDFDETTPLQNVALNQWQTIYIGTTTVQVFYATHWLHAFKALQKLSHVNIWYINGMLHPVFSVLPLLVAKWRKLSKLVISPRGMLQQGALQQQAMKKQVFLTVAKTLGLYNNAYFHATDEQEREDIGNILAATNRPIYCVGNVVPIPKSPENATVKTPGILQLCYLSIISPKKQLHLVLQTMAYCKQQITLHVYGPCKDTAYLATCKTLAEQLPANCTVQWMGAVTPPQVSGVFQRYHASVLLSSGENFGHAIYQSLATAVPVIISHFTPWKNLQSQQAGWNLDTTQPAIQLAQSLDDLALMNHEQWLPFYKGAQHLANTYFHSQNWKPAYRQIFSTNTLRTT